MITKFNVGGNTCGDTAALIVGLVIVLLLLLILILLDWYRRIVIMELSGSEICVCLKGGV